MDPKVTETVRRPASRRCGEAAQAVPARPSVAMVGAGRAGSAMAVALAAAGYRVTAVAGRDRNRADALAGRVGARVAPSPLAAMRSAAVTLVAVPDVAIVGVAAAAAASGVALTGRGVAHLCAAHGPEALAALRGAGAAVGAVHPLQALAGEGSAPLLRGSLMALEADPPLDAELRRLAADLACRPVVLPPGSRPLYHAAAVLAGNAPLALLGAAVELLAAPSRDPAGAGEGAGALDLTAEAAERGLIALMRGALSNAERAGARAALTGPVARGDVLTVAAHLAALRRHPDAAALYRALGRATLCLSGEEGREAIARLLQDGEPRPRGSARPAGAPTTPTAASRPGRALPLLCDPPSPEEHLPCP